MVEKKTPLVNITFFCKKRKLFSKDSFFWEFKQIWNTSVHVR